ncbi:tape measure protein [Limosilactobacillus vaginalis]|uniref:tape measure protein n=1 Tax=Limosilactobacillus vaginalis TaxID=1633 RepID=UPI000F51A1F2|nr:tape measure protein [Limosilactobacillus vaginalis]
MSTAVVTKEFIWKFIDQVTEGVKQARAAMNQAENSAKQAGLEVRNSGANWKKAGDDAEQAAQKTTEAVNKSKNSISELSNEVKDKVVSVRNSLDLYENKLNGIPKEKVTNLTVKAKDSALKAHEKMINDVPPEKGTILYIKDAFSNRLQDFKNKFHNATTSAQHDVDNTKRSFSTLKSVMAGTFVGGAVLNGIYSIGNGLKEAGSAGMEFDTEQQKMLATWHTLTGSAHQAQGMVDTINDLSIKTGQATDTINELEQGFYHLHSSKSEADDMTKAMLNMGDAVGLSGQQLTQVEQDMVHGLATGKVTQGELNQIGMYFPMIDERMAKHFNTTVAGMRKMASAGKITGKDLEEVFEQMGNSGKYKHAVDNMMQTTWGSFRTIHSMIPRLVGSLENGLFQARNPLVGAIAKWTTDPTTKTQFRNFGKSLADSFNDLVTALQGIGSLIGPVLKAFGSGIWLGFSTVIKSIAQTFMLVAELAGKVSSAISGSAKSFGAFKVGGEAVKAVGTSFGALIAVMTVYKTATMTAAAVTKTFTAAQSLLDAALDANPIGLIVIAIAALVGGLVLAYKHIKPFRDAVNRLGESIKRVFTGKSSWDKAIVNQFKALNKAFDRDGKAFQKKLSQFNKSIWNGLTGKAKWEKSIGNAFKNMQKEYDRYSKQQLKDEQKAQRERQKNWDNFWKGLSKKSSNAWKDIKNYTQTGIENVAKETSKRSKNIEKGWNNTWNSIGRFTSRTWQDLKKNSSIGMSELHRAISSGLNTINGIWRSGWNAFSNFFRGIWNGIKQAAQDGMNGVINVINAGINGINKVWSFFTGHGTGLGTLSKVHFAQGGTVHRHLSVINDGDGPDWKELVQTPDGNLFMSQQRNWTGFLPEGTRVYSGAETKQIMNAVGVSHYAGGGIVGDIEDDVSEAIDWTKGSLDNIGSWIGDKIDALMDFLDNPVQSVKGLIDKATKGMYDGLGNFAGIAKGTWDKLTQPIADWFKKGLEPILDQLEEANPGGSGVQRWRPFIRRAARMEGINLTSTMMNKMLTQINTESGGNPAAIGGTDGLADGHATGLLQFKPGTFRSWIWHGHSNIMNGFDQILAAFNALQHGGEGGWANFGIPGKGWATGGEIFSQQLGWVGDNPQHHEIVLNPYAPSADHLLDRAFETTASAQPGSGNASQGNSKLDRMIGLLEMLLDSVDSIDPNTYLDGEMITKNANKRNAKVYARREI